MLNRFKHLNDLEASALELLILQHGGDELKAAINQTFTEKSLNQLVEFGVISSAEKAELIETLQGHCISEYLSDCSEFDHLKKVCLIALDVLDFDYAAGLAGDHQLVDDLLEVKRILMPDNLSPIVHDLVYENGIDFDLFFSNGGYTKLINTHLGTYYLVCKDGSL